MFDFIMAIPHKSARASDERLCVRKRREIAGKLCVFQGLKKDISAISSQYDTVYMFGVDKCLTDSIRIELCARNHDETANTALEISHLEERLQAGEVSYTVSSTPTCYLCNTAYFLMLQKNPHTVFIHIPSLGGMAPEMMQKLIVVFREIYFA